LFLFFAGAGAVPGVAGVVTVGTKGAGFIGAAITVPGWAGGAVGTSYVVVKG
jgi:hypothetical protein